MGVDINSLQLTVFFGLTGLGSLFSMIVPGTLLSRTSLPKSPWWTLASLLGMVITTPGVFLVALGFAAQVTGYQIFHFNSVIVMIDGLAISLCGFAMAISAGKTERVHVHLGNR